jgi:hypothetical protein
MLRFVVLVFFFFFFLCVQSQSDIVTTFVLEYDTADPYARIFCQESGVGNFIPPVNDPYHEFQMCRFGISYNVYASGAFSVGIEGGNKGLYSDLGTTSDVDNRYGVPETAGGAVAFSSLHYNMSAGQWVIAAKNGNGFQPLLPSDVPAKDGGNIPVNQGHIYLLAMNDPARDPSNFLFGKFLVLSNDTTGPRVRFTPITFKSNTLKKHH